MFIVQRKGTPRDGNNPTLLYGYGGSPACHARRNFLQAVGLRATLENLQQWAGISQLNPDWHRDSTAEALLMNYVTKWQHSP